MLTHHGVPLLDVVENSTQQSVELHAGLQDEARVQAHFSQHGQQQEQLVVGVRPRTESHAQTQVLRTATKKGQASGQQFQRSNVVLCETLDNSEPTIGLCLTFKTLL